LITEHYDVRPCYGIFSIAFLILEFMNSSTRVGSLIFYFILLIIKRIEQFDFNTSFCGFLFDHKHKLSTAICFSVEDFLLCSWWSWACHWRSD